jgi:hypothetical protein
MLIIFLMNAPSISFGATVTDGQVRVPLIVEVSYAIAGAEFAFEHSTGLEFVSYEKSSTVSSASTTPVVVKNGQTHFGFYNADNRYTPVNGKLDVGYLVFNRSDNDGQLVKLTEIRLVQVIDKDNTRSELLAPVEIKISSENNTEDSSTNKEGTGGATSSTGTKKPSTATNDGTSLADTKNPATNKDGDALPTDKDLPAGPSKNSWVPDNFWVIIVLLIIATCGAGIFFLKKRVNPK